RARSEGLSLSVMAGRRRNPRRPSLWAQRQWPGASPATTAPQVTERPPWGQAEATSAKVRQSLVFRALSEVRRFGFSAPRSAAPGAPGRSGAAEKVRDDGVDEVRMGERRHVGALGDLRELPARAGERQQLDNLARRPGRMPGGEDERPS